ncbi:nitroreductase [Pseudoalteromonas lipolytica SCSIO 04301]|uniref:NAD(P)H nitroreductase n=1 Tax=Pseudoalteromonas lipolytica TaxID=570156 RepID=UPI0004504E4C|nr:NAD(P)H nitroreductase [Pseudoalteromonas lipolytica]EWH07074.1 nitroreductase [Pseudoalteromonas lipolytica SCSIO 04301]
MDALTLLQTRQSDPRLISPGPTEEQLSIIQRAAIKVPDHGCIAPWRFIVVEGEARHKLGEIYHQAAIEEQQDDRVIERAKELPLRAPMVIIAIADVKENPKVPRIEQVQSAGCAVLAMQQAAFAQGLGGIWRTGYFAQSPAVKHALGCKSEDEIVGYLYIGTPEVDIKKPIRHKPDTFFEKL